MPPEPARPTCTATEAMRTLLARLQRTHVASQQAAIAVDIRALAPAVRAEQDAAWDRLAAENAALRAALNTILAYITPYEYARRAGADIVFPETDVAAIARCARAALNAATAPAAPGTAGDPTGGTYRKVVD